MQRLQRATSGSPWPAGNPLPPPSASLPGTVLRQLGSRFWARAEDVSVSGEEEDSSEVDVTKESPLPSPRSAPPPRVFGVSFHLGGAWCRRRNRSVPESSRPSHRVATDPSSRCRRLRWLRPSRGKSSRCFPPWVAVVVAPRRFRWVLS
jgi:hypothetical protein